MKSKQIIILMLGLLIPVLASAQTDVALDPEFGGRVSVSLDKRITRGLHISIEEEVRIDNNFGSFDRLQTTLALSYKVHPNIKLGLGYALINGYGTNSESFKNPRHRLMAALWQLELFAERTLSSDATHGRFQRISKSPKRPDAEKPREGLV